MIIAVSVDVEVAGATFKAGGSHKMWSAPSGIAAATFDDSQGLRLWGVVQLVDLVVEMERADTVVVWSSEGVARVTSPFRESDGWIDKAFDFRDRLRAGGADPVSLRRLAFQNLGDSTAAAVVFDDEESEMIGRRAVLLFDVFDAWRGGMLQVSEKQVRWPGVGL